MRDIARHFEVVREETEPRGTLSRDYFHEDNAGIPEKLLDRRHSPDTVSVGDLIIAVRSFAKGKVDDDKQIDS